MLDTHILSHSILTATLWVGIISPDLYIRHLRFSELLLNNYKHRITFIISWNCPHGTYHMLQYDIGVWWRWVWILALPLTLTGLLANCLHCPKTLSLGVWDVPVETSIPTGQYWGHKVGATQECLVLGQLLPSLRYSGEVKFINSPVSIPPRNLFLGVGVWSWFPKNSLSPKRAWTFNASWVLIVLNTFQNGFPGPTSNEMLWQGGSMDPQC